MTADFPDGLLEVAAGAARAAGEVLARLHGGPLSVQTKSTATDPVSEADRAAEQTLVDHILGRRADDGLLGEEGARRQGSSGLRWVLDPLDGTVNYLYGLPGWCVSVACEDDDGALVGVVYDPGRDEIFTAERGGAARCNDQVLAVAEPVALETALIATGFAYDPDVRARQAAHLVTLLPRVRDVRRFGAAAADLCAVGAGRLDAYYESGLAPWDRCAGTVIAREAGARVEELDPGDALSGSVTVATHPDAWDDFTALLHEAGVLS